MVENRTLWYVDRVLSRWFEWWLLLVVFALSAAVSSGFWPHAALNKRVQQLITDLGAGATAHANACTELMRLGPAAGAAVPALLAHADRGEDVLALNTLLRIGPAAATGGLIQALEGKDKKTALLAAQVIGLFGPAAAAAKPALLRAASDPDLQSAAAAALRAVEGEVDFTQELRRR